jgi:hypothetical protein
MNSCSTCDSKEPLEFFCDICFQHAYCSKECGLKHWEDLGHQTECELIEKKGGGGKFVQKMHMHEGAFTAKAKSAGMTPAKYQAAVLKNPKNYDSKTVKQANLRKTLVHMKKKGKK